MARTKGSTGETTKPRIRAAAARLLATHGYDGVTMRGIGADVGLRAGAIYRYFPDKASLAADLVAEALAEQAEVLAGGDPGAKPLDALEDFTNRYLDWRMEPRGAAGLIELCLPALGAAGATLAEAHPTPEAALEAILSRGQEDTSLRVPDTLAGARAVLAVLHEVARDERLAEDRRKRVGWNFVRRLVKA